VLLLLLFAGMMFIIVPTTVAVAVARSWHNVCEALCRNNLLCVPYIYTVVVEAKLLCGG